MANAPTNTKVELTIKMIDLTVTMIHPPVAAQQPELMLWKFCNAGRMKDSTIT